MPDTSVTRSVSLANGAVLKVVLDVDRDPGLHLHHEGPRGDGTRWQEEVNVTPDSLPGLVGALLGVVADVKGAGGSTDALGPVPTLLDVLAGVRDGLNVRLALEKLAEGRSMNGSGEGGADDALVYLHLGRALRPLVIGLAPFNEQARADLARDYFKGGRLTDDGSSHLWEMENHASRWYSDLNEMWEDQRGMTTEAVDDLCRVLEALEHTILYIRGIQDQNQELREALPDRAPVLAPTSVLCALESRLGELHVEVSGRGKEVARV